jgi:hypothetical protein
MANTLEQGKVYNLSTKAPSILGARLERVTLIGILTYELAQKFENINLQYRQVYPLLPPGTPDSVKACTYYLFRTSKDKQVVLADQWINMDSVTVVDGISFQVSFHNRSISDANRLRDILNAMGMTEYEITIL